MKPKTILILFVILLLLVAVSIYPSVQDKLGIKTKNTLLSEIPFSSFTKDSVNELLIRKNPVEFTLRKDGDTWKAASYSALNSKIDALFNAFKETNVAYVASKNTASDSDYGLASNSGTFITVVTKSGSSQYILGKAGPQTNSFYAKKENGTIVYLMTGSVIDNLPLSISDWRNKTLMNINISNIKSIETQGDIEFTLTKNANGNWDISNKSKNKQVLECEISQVTGSYSPLDGSEFTDEKESKELDDEKKNTVTFKDKDGKILGAFSYLNKDAYYWLKSDTNAEGMKVPGYKLDNFFKLNEKLK